MRVLIDECLPAGLKESVTTLGHECETVRRAGYGAKKNGELLYQQNMSGRNVSILILCAKSNRIKALLPLMPSCARALLSILPGRLDPGSQMGEKTKPAGASYYRARYYDPQAGGFLSEDPSGFTGGTNF